MESVSLSREIAAPAERIRAAIDDHEAFMRAAKFDEVRATDGTIEIANAVGLFRIELTLEVIDRPGAALAYVQREGIFETMDTEYRLAETDGGTTVTATTEFAVGASFVGPLFDATVVKRQRRRELDNQFDYLEEACA